MSTQSHEPTASPCLGFLSQEQDGSWITVEDWRSDFVMSANGSFVVPELEPSLSVNTPGLPSPDPFLFGNNMDWELSPLEPGFESMETLIDFSSLNFEAILAEEGIFNCPSPLPLELNSPDSTSVASDGSSWGMSPVQSSSSPPPSFSPHLSLALSQDDPVPPYLTIPIDSDTYAPPEGPRILPVAPIPSCTKVCAQAPRSSARDRELASHNVRVNPQELKDKLTEEGHSDKIESLDNLLVQIGEFITFREIYGYDRDTRTHISPPEVLGAPSFAPFLRKRHKDDAPHTNRKILLYACMFCEHELSNRTQMVQHLMARHFRYFPYECDECYATFCRRADLIKHGSDKHSGVSVTCRCGKRFSNRRNYQRHRKPKRGDDCSRE